MDRPTEQMSVGDIREKLLELDIAEDKLRLEADRIRLERAELELVRHRIEARQQGGRFRYA